MRSLRLDSGRNAVLYFSACSLLAGFCAGGTAERRVANVESRCSREVGLSLNVVVVLVGVFESTSESVLAKSVSLMTQGISWV